MPRSKVRTETLPARPSDVAGLPLATADVVQANLSAHEARTDNPHAVTAAQAGAAPAVHTHVIGDTTGLQAALDSKAATAHTHAIADTTGLQAALDSKAVVGGATEQVQFNDGGVLAGALGLIWKKVSGWLGIGTTNPQAPVHIVGVDNTAGAFPELLMSDSTPMALGVGGGFGLQGKFTAGGSYATLAAIKAGKETATDGDYKGYLSFWTQPSSLTERVRISSAGYVGIGTTAPAAELHIKGGAVANPGFRIHNDLAGGAAWQFSVASDGQARLTEIGVAAWFTIDKTTGRAVFAAATSRHRNPAQQSTSLTGTVNDFSLTGARTFLLCGNTSALMLTGFTVGGASPQAGDEVILQNVGGSTVQITHEGATSTASSRCLTSTGAAVTVNPGGRLTGFYDTAVARWRFN